MCCVWQLKLGTQLRGGMQITAEKGGIVSMEKMSNSRRASCKSSSLILVSPSERELKSQTHFHHIKWKKGCFFCASREGEQWLSLPMQFCYPSFLSVTEA